MHLSRGEVRDRSYQVHSASLKKRTWVLAFDDGGRRRDSVERGHGRERRVEGQVRSRGAWYIKATGAVLDFSRRPTGAVLAVR